MKNAVKSVPGGGQCISLRDGIAISCCDGTVKLMGGGMA
jgi:hypothetical protein